MLAKANRLLKADDFRVTMKTGRKVSSSTVVIYLKRDLGNTQSRFGFVVAKSVGNAVKRNLVKRRLRALSATVVDLLPAGTDVVIRALPDAAAADWNKLSSEFNTAMSKVLPQAQG